MLASSVKPKPHHSGGLSAALPAEVRLLLVDDHGIVRDGLAMLLDRESDIRVIGCAASGEAAIADAKRLKPDLVIMDLVLPGLNGLEATRQIVGERPLTYVIALSAHRSRDHALRALRAGARGYVVKTDDASELIQAVRTVNAGRQYVSPAITPPFTEDLAELSIMKSAYERLSAREREVLHRLVTGASSAHIAQDLFLSRKTVDTYRSRIMLKLGVDNRSSLIRFAMEHEMTPL